MSKFARAYVLSVILAGIVSLPVTISHFDNHVASWSLFGTILVGAILAQLYEARYNRQSFYPHLVFFLAAVFLLHPFLFALVISIPHLVEWGIERVRTTGQQRVWYVQLFNIATHILAGVASALFLGTLAPEWLHTQNILSTCIVFCASLFYVIINHLLVGVVLVVARGVSLRQSGIFSMDSLLPDLVMAWLGCVVALLWTINLVWVGLALSPLLLMYQALRVPQLQQEAQLDGKTGVFNARHIMTLFTTELEQARRTSRPLVFIMADLDFLRTVNNTYGHLAGDVVLAGLGRIIQQTIRINDLVGRFGGEEFVIILPNTDYAGARVLAEKLRQAIEATPFTVPTSASPIYVTMSFGVACFPQDATAPDDLMHAADVAVYAAKRQGRNRVVCVADLPPDVQSASLHGQQSAGETAPVPTAESCPTATQQQHHSEAIGGAVPSASTPTAVPAPDPSPATRASRVISQPLFWMFVSSVIAAGVGVTLLSLITAATVDIVLLAVLLVLALLAEWFQVNVYGRNTISVSVAIAFAAALLIGIPGAAVVSMAIVLAHSFKRRPPIYRALFNWSTHVLAAVVPVVVIQALQLSFHPTVVPILMVPIALASFGYYLVDTGLIAGAMSLSMGASIRKTWQEQFQWLIVHYLVLCGLGFFASVVYTTIGMLGLLMCALPLFLARYAQKQYVAHTEASMASLQNLNTELMQANNDVSMANKAIQALNDELFETLARFFDARDPYVGGHAAAVGEYATAIAQEVGISGNQLKQIRQAGFLHDIGKIAIPESILHKPSKLTDVEFDQMKTHAALGAGLVAQSHGLQHLASFIRHHHERWDGRGYPDGLRGEEIPLEARILNVCDSVEAMASDRPYHQGMTLPEVIAEVQRCSGTQFDPQIAEAFLRVVERAGGTFVINSAREVSRRQKDIGRLLDYTERPNLRPEHDVLLQAVP